MTSVIDRARAAKAETEERLSRRGGSGAQFWKPKNGKNTIRIMPPWTDPLGEGKALSDTLQVFQGQYWREVGQHWNVSPDQRGPILCPKKTPGLDAPCPICEFVSELKKDKTNAKAKQLSDDIRAKTTFLLNIVDMTDAIFTAQDAADWKTNKPGDDVPFEIGDPKIQIYAAPITVHDVILGIITDTGNDVTKLATGQAIVLTKFPNKNPKLTRYQCLPTMKPGAFELQDPEQSLPSLHQTGFTMTYQEMLDLLHGGVGGAHVAALPESAPTAALTSGVAEEAADAVDLEAQMRAAL